MYLAHFGLREPPFSITPDPRFLYMSGRHREALAHLIYGVGEHGGFVQLTGEVGTGKTSVCRCLLEQLPANVDLALVFNPQLSPVELLATVCDELRIAYPAGTTSPKELVDRLHRHLLEAHTAGRRTVLIIDEAQNLAPEVLEEVRLLTNLETAREKLLQVILIGQPELAAILEQPKLRQLAQRVTARYHLEPLSRLETAAYIRHRLAVAGRGRAVFTERRAAVAVPPVARHSPHHQRHGRPRPAGRLHARALPGGRGDRAARGGRGAGPDAGCPGAAGCEAPPWRPSSPPSARSDSCSSRRARSAGATSAGRPACRASRVPRSRAGSRCWPARRASPSPGPRLADVLRDPGVPATKGDALAVLHGLWGVPAAGMQPDCERPAPGALECLAAVGTWQKLRRLDLPAALELAAPGGERRYGVLTALTPSEATLRFGDRVVTALLPEVEPFWNGGFVLLWRPPPGELPVRRGARGPATDWLRQRMGRASGQPIEPGLPYDQALWERVTAFQQARSLEPDGVVGRETAIVLRGAEWGPEVPRLAAGVR